MLGAGSWGTALTIALASRFEEVSLWARDAAQADTIAQQRENARYLAGFPLPGHIRDIARFATHDIGRRYRIERGALALPA